MNLPLKFQNRKWIGCWKKLNGTSFVFTYDRRQVSIMSICGLCVFTYDCRQVSIMFICGLCVYCVYCLIFLVNPGKSLVNSNQIKPVTWWYIFAFDRSRSENRTVHMNAVDFIVTFTLSILTPLDLPKITAALGLYMKLHLFGYVSLKISCSILLAWNEALNQFANCKSGKMNKKWAAYVTTCQNSSKWWRRLNWLTGLKQVNLTLRDYCLTMDSGN